MATPSANQYFEAIHTGPGDPTSPNLFTAAELVAGSFSSAAVSSATSTAVSTVNAAAPDSSSISQAKSQAVSAATNASIADSKAVSNSANVSVADSKALSVSGSTSIADSKAVSAAAYTNFPSAVTSTADSKAVSVATNLGSVPAGRTITTISQYNTNNAIYNALDFGIVGGNVGNQAAAFNTFFNTTVPAGATAYVPPDTYAIGGNIVVTRNSIRILQFGVTYKHTGGGAGFTFDGSAIPNGLTDVECWGGTVDGDVNTTIAWRFLIATRSKFLNQKARNCSSRAYSAEYCICCTFDNPRCTTNDGSMTYKPSNGFYIDRRNVNENATDNIIINPVFEGLTGANGINCQYATGNLFLGGTSEANGTGILSGVGSSTNQFIALFSELNTAYDIDESGTFNIYENCHMNGTLGSRFRSGAAKNAIRYGYFPTGFTIDAGCYGTDLDSIAYDGTITDNGTATQRRKIWKVSVGTQYDPDVITRRLLVGSTGSDTLEDLQVGQSIKAKRFITTGTTPTKIAGTGAGTSPTITITGTDMAGLISLTTGTAPAGSGATVLTMVYNIAYAGGVTPRFALSPANTNAAALSGTTQVFCQIDNGQLYIISGSAALTASTLYQWNYIIMA